MPAIVTFREDEMTGLPARRLSERFGFRPAVGVVDHIGRPRQVFRREIG